jgi:PadR family transcriptional regulator PadR
LREKEGIIMSPNETTKNPVSLEDNLKKALTELLVLQLLSQRDYYIGELTATLKHKSNDTLNIVFPYGAIYRLQQSDYIAEGQKRIAPDGRRRQYYTITPKGIRYLQQLRSIYTRFIQGVDTVLTSD